MLRDRIKDLTCELLPTPKGLTFTRGFSVVEGGFVGEASRPGGKTNGVVWMDGKAMLLEVPGRKRVEARMGHCTRFAGHWDASTSKTKLGPVVFAVANPPTATELSSAHYDPAYAVAADAHSTVGFGRTKQKNSPSRAHALWWRGDRGEPIELDAGAPDADAMARGVDGEDVVGQASHRPALWRNGTLHALSTDRLGEAVAVAGGEQVGTVWTKNTPRAALWQGTPASLVDLTPAGFAIGMALDVDANLQVGMIKEKESTPKGVSSPLNRAVVWAGSADGYVDLQAAAPEGFNVSEAMGIAVRGDAVVVVGTVSVFNNTDGIPSVSSHRACVWKFTKA